MYIILYIIIYANSTVFNMFKFENALLLDNVFIKIYNI